MHCVRTGVSPSGGPQLRAERPSRRSGAVEQTEKARGDQDRSVETQGEGKTFDHDLGSLLANGLAINHSAMPETCHNLLF